MTLAASSRCRGPGLLNVPGARASTVQADMWNLCFEAVSRSRSGISSFFHTMLRHRVRGHRAPEGKIWPMPLPFPEMHVRHSNRSQPDGGRKLGVNYVVLVLSWLAVGERVPEPFTLGLGTKLNRAQWDVVKEVVKQVDVWNSTPAIDSAAMGRSAGKVESIEDLLAALENEARPAAKELRSYLGFDSSGPQNFAGHFGHPGEECGELSFQPDNAAKDVEPHRLQFHGEPSFDPTPFLDYDNMAKFLCPLEHAVDPSQADVTIPVVRVRCGKRCCLKLLELLDSSGRLKLVSAASVRTGLENGLFCIPKDCARDRLIMDARAPNACECSDSPWIKSLGSLQQFNHVFLKPGERLLLHAEDLKEYYHSFIISEQRQLRNALKISYLPSELRHLQCFDESLLSCERVVPCLNTMAMGDTNSVTFGQVSHLSAILRTGEFDLEDFLCLTQRPSRKHWLCGLMIDDFVLCERVPHDKPQVDTLGSRKVQCVRDQYAKVGLPRHPDKSVSGSPHGTFWGGQLDGIAGTIRPTMTRLVPLAHILLRVVRLKVATVGLLEILGGALVSAFQMRRRFMSCLSEIYSAQRNRARTTLVQLSRQLLDELMVCVGLLPLTLIDLRLTPAPVLVASDASTRAEAAVATPVTPIFTEEAQRYSLQKGLWNRLLSPAGALLKEHGQLRSEDELPEESYDMHPLWKEVCETLQFGKFGSVKRSSKREHINLKEISAALQAERDVGALYPSSYYVHLQDSQVSLACLIKGRSSSFYINKKLRASVPHQVGHNVRPFYGFVRSKENPADDPTRDAQLRSPRREVPPFLASAMEGNFDLLDSFLATHQLRVIDLGGLPSADELKPMGELDVRTSAEVRSCRRPKQQKAQVADGTSSSREGAVGVASDPVSSSSMSAQVGLASGTVKCDPGCSLADCSHSAAVARCPHPVTGESIASFSVEALCGAGSANSCADWVSVVKKFPRSQFVFSKKFGSLDEALKSGPGLLDLFSGARGFARAFVRDHATWAVCFDIKHSLKEDLLDPSLQQTLEALVVAGAFRAMSASPVYVHLSPQRLHHRGGHWSFLEASPH